MLIFFWSLAGIIEEGNLTSMTWCCHSDRVAYCLCTTDVGFDIINPYWEVSCYRGLLNTPCTSIDYFDDKILVATQVSGIYSFPWSLISVMESNQDITTSCTGYLGVSTGLKSDTIKKINSNQDYLGIITNSGLEWMKSSTPGTIYYEDPIATDVFVRQDGSTYLCTGTSVKVKDGEPVDFSTWDYTYTVSGSVNNIWINELTNTVFLATESGAVVFRDLRASTQFKYINEFPFYHSPTFTGSRGTKHIAIESDTSYDWGHFFTTTSNTIFDIDLKLDKIMQTFEISYNIVDLEYPRLWTR